MEECITINLEIQDRMGKSSITVDGAGYEGIRGKVLEHLDYVYRSERFVNIHIEAQERGRKTSRGLEKVGYMEARDRVSEFLGYVYHVQGVYVEAPPAVPVSDPATWLGLYDLGSLSQKEKVLALFRHNHANDWVMSQDLQDEYEKVFGEPIKLSSLSTYLARFHEEGPLERKGSRAQREYRLLAAPPAP
ncbi:MAG: hypothetical protein AABX40_01025 [Candidatus Hydrothermarchaeota archaeon]